MAQKRKARFHPSSVDAAQKKPRMKATAYQRRMSVSEMITLRRAPSRDVGLTRTTGCVYHKVRGGGSSGGNDGADFRPRAFLHRRRMARARPRELARGRGSRDGRDLRAGPARVGARTSGARSPPRVKRSTRPLAPHDARTAIAGHEAVRDRGRAGASAPDRAADPRAGCTRLMAEHLQVGPPIEHLSWYADRAARDPDERLPSHKGPPPSDSIVTREPVGVVAAIVPWNFPLYIAAHKWARRSRWGIPWFSSRRRGPPVGVRSRRRGRAGRPPSGVLNVVTGAGAEVGEELASNTARRHGVVHRLHRVRQARHAARLANVKKVSLELGGKSAGIVLEDAALEKAVPHLLWSWLVHQGQACGAATRFVLHEPFTTSSWIVSRPVKGCRSAIRRNGRRSSGPLIRGSHRESVERYIAIGQRGGRDAARRRRPAAHLSKGSTSSRRSSPTCATTCASRRRRSSGPSCA